MKELIGKTVVKVERSEFDYVDDGEAVGEVYRITCSDGSVLHFMVDGGPGTFWYARIGFVKLKVGKLEGFIQGSGHLLVPFKELDNKKGEKP